MRQQLISEAVFDEGDEGRRRSRRRTSTATTRTHTSLYTQPQTRDVRHILVEVEDARADSIYSQLKAGNDKTWCTLAKKYSKDPSSKNMCGKLTVPKGQTVAEFDKVAFSAADERRAEAGPHTRSTAGS